METVWLLLLVFMIATYVVLDGFDLGVGVLHLLLARNRAEQKQIMQSIAPLWDGNEVWLIAAGGTMMMAFPGFLSSMFSGFYLPLTMVVWLLIFRAISIELPHFLEDSLWIHFWNMMLFVSSGLLIVILGAAMANVFRGVPLDATGSFFEPLWTNFRIGKQTGILDWFTILGGITSATILLHHGALWLIAKTDGVIQQRALKGAAWLWGGSLLLTLVMFAACYQVQTQARGNFSSHPWMWILPVLALLSLGGSLLFRKRQRHLSAFLCSGAFIYLFLFGGTAALYPNLLPGLNPEHHLTIYNTSPSTEKLATTLWWWIPGILLVGVYFTILFRSLPPVISASSTDEH
ncbi:Cytochrome bd-I ubiquinol oxidase subunit 2 [Gimesia panareensis]|uniref:Cytochrome bd-I ubiquinol oxidase subunit 2 n=1 Tax=Gimesia panareensis TaxID=2527978 RepID=A0A517QD77_9PLAN|nr:cytochrome d ubiquinol oxidase subunit II [Gimesia panareensis]QDT29586.1 Cytochrome bd-I ubiquinol oxidase subunit 2 [Gimesia panareensis]